MINTQKAPKMYFRITCTVKAPNWHTEHKARQYRLIEAIDQNIISEQCAEMLDAFDNFLRFTWVSASPICLLSSN